jgi:glycosyltransferase involved in cell wall biosynthesis
MSLEIACIIPVRNGAAHIGEALDSCLAQRLPPEDIVVVDDGSEDETSAVVAHYVPKVRYFRQDWTGAAAAMNFGVAATRSPLIAFIDHDDLWLPEKLECQACVLAQNPEVEAVFCHLTQFISPETPSELAGRLHCPSTPQVGICASAILIRRESLLRFDPFEGGRDASAFMKWQVRAQMADFAYKTLREVLVRRRLHASNSSRREASLNHEIYLDCARELITKRRGRNS